MGRDAMIFSMDEGPIRVASPGRRRHSSRNRSNSRSAQPPASTQHLTAAEDDNGSLTYSAASSMTSAGESTDSSFGEIMRVLDQDHTMDPSATKELEHFMHREGLDPRAYHQQQPLQSSRVLNRRDQRSVVSLTYSTDGESNDFTLQTISGQSSDSLGPDGGGGRNDVVFAPADTPTPRSKKRNSRSNSSTVAVKSRPVHAHSHHNNVPILERLHHSGATTAAAAAAPPKPRRRTRSVPTTPTGRAAAQNANAEGLSYYAKWWMCGFTDAFKDLAMVPK